MVLRGARISAALMLLCAGRAEAQPCVGVSGYALLSPQYHAGTVLCERFIRTYERALQLNPGLCLMTAVLPGTFGDDWSCVGEWVRRLRAPKILEVHASNETNSCRANPRRCGPGELLPGVSASRYSSGLERGDGHVVGALRERYRSLAAAVRQVADDQTGFVVSTGVESKFTLAAEDAAERIAREEIPGVNVVANVLKHPAYRGHADFWETHGSSGRVDYTPCIANEDGHDGGASQSRVWGARYQRCHRLFWRRRHQGLPADRRHAKAPLRRTFIYPESDVESLAHLMAGH